MLTFKKIGRQAKNWLFFAGIGVIILIPFSLCVDSVFHYSQYILDYFSDDKQPAFAEYRLRSASMEPRLSGPHYRWNCPVCSHSFVASFNLQSDVPVSETPEVVKWNEVVRFTGCPRCGFSEVPFDPQLLEEGDMLTRQQVSPISSRTAKKEGAISRWDIVLFENNNRLWIKRVVGLPGEKVTIIDGDLSINNLLHVKTVKTLQRLRIPVEEVVTRNDDSLTIFSHSHPIPRLDRNLPPQVQLEPITNQSETPTLEVTPVDRIENVRDLLLEMTIDFSESFSPLTVFANQGTSLWSIDFDLLTGDYSIKMAKKSSVSSLPNGLDSLAWPNAESVSDWQLIVQGDIPDAISESIRNKKICEIEFYLYDRQLTFILDHQVIESFDRRQYESNELIPALPPIAEPFAIALGGATLQNYSIWRDLHYGSTGNIPNLEVTIPSDSVYLLGDNSPVSLDSRFLSPPTIPLKKIRAKTM